MADTLEELMDQLKRRHGTIISAWMVAEAPWSGAEWTVALRFDNLRATVLVGLLSDTPSTGFWVPNAPKTLKDHRNALKASNSQ